MPFIYSLGDKFAKISDDQTIAVIDPRIESGELNPEIFNFLKGVIENDSAIPFAEVLTTIGMLRRVLKKFPGKEGKIRVGISSTQQNGAAIMRISNEVGRIVVVAGRNEI